MEVFNVKRRDIFDFDSYMDLKKPGFGGPNSAKMYKDGRGNLVNQKPKLKEYQRQVERHPQFGHQVYDPTYKAMTHDLVYKQSKKKPFTYRDPYLTGLPVVDMTKIQEGLATSSFNQFINESHERVELAIRLVDGGLVPKHKMVMLDRLVKYPGSLVELRGTEDELAFAAEVYQIQCEEVMDGMGGVSGLICRADDLLAAMEEIEMSSMDSTDLFNLPEEF
jgi:hypothetical protein